MGNVYVRYGICTVRYNRVCTVLVISRMRLLCRALQTLYVLYLRPLGLSEPYCTHYEYRVTERSEQGSE